MVDYIQDLKALQEYTDNINQINDSDMGDPTRPEDFKVKSSVNLVNTKRKDLLTQFAVSISNTVQFPRSTVFLHALGCVAAAMNKSFSVNYYGSLPVCLYVVTAQPPSTGKSGVNNYLSLPIRAAYKELNQKNAKIISKAQGKLKKLTVELKGDLNEEQEDAILCDMANEHETIESNPIFKAIVTNATPEALEVRAFKQKGIFNIISDEAGSINSVLGLSYGAEGKIANADLVLKGWDGGHFDSERVSRDASYGVTRGSIAVIAQSETITAILKVGERGHGVSERFLLCDEPNLLGKRNHLKHINIDKKLSERYAKLISNLVMAGDTELHLDNDAVDYLKQQKQEAECHLSDTGKYSENMLRGFAGKMDKQVVKIASVLHAIKYFEETTLRTHCIEKSTVQWACEIFAEVTKLYVDTADEQGFVGRNTQIKSCYDYLLAFKEKSGVIIKIQRMLNSIKKQSAWRNQTKQMSHFRAVIMPRLVEMNICVYSNDTNSLIINEKL